MFGCFKVTTIRKRSINNIVLTYEDEILMKYILVERVYDRYGVFVDHSGLTLSALSFDLKHRRSTTGLFFFFFFFFFFLHFHPFGDPYDMFMQLFYL